MHASTRATLITLILAIATLIAAIIAGVTIVLTRLSGTPLPSACLRGGIAFAGTLTLQLAIITTIENTLK
jgi:ABC-type amino acid transport system permease subunit